MLPCYTTPNTHVSVMHKDDNSSLALKVFSKYFTQHVSLTVYGAVNFLRYVTQGASITTVPKVLID